MAKKRRDRIPSQRGIAARPVPAGGRRAAVASRSEAAMQQAEDLVKAGRQSEAIDRLRVYVASATRDDPARAMLGMLLASIGSLDEAMGHARRAVHAYPRLAFAHEVLCFVLTRQDRIVEAVAAGERAVELDPMSAQSHRVLAVALQNASSFETAARHIDRAIELEPGHEAGYGTAIAIRESLGDFRGALAVVEAARGRGLASDALAWNEARARLGVGDLAGGWDLYEHGFAAGVRNPHRPLPVPRWQGEDLTGSRLLLWPEQGMGDELRFLSCLPDLLEDGVDIVLESSPRLIPLLRRSFPGVAVRTESSTRVRDQDAADLRGIDVHAPVGDLARFLRRRVEDFPARRGYLDPHPDMVDGFRRRLDEIGPGLKVGIAWRSGYLKTNRLSFYFTLDEMLPLLQVPGIHLVNLQYSSVELRERELADLERRHGVVVHRWEDVDYTDDIEAVAALTSCLDVVVGPASFPVVMAGALGVRGYQLGPPSAYSNPDVAWLPSVEMVTRTTDQPWDQLFEYVVQELADVV